jgi:uncharacterized protein YgiM (DUF1202 family)
MLSGPLIAAVLAMFIRPIIQRRTGWSRAWTYLASLALVLVVIYGCPLLLAAGWEFEPAFTQGLPPTGSGATPAATRVPKVPGPNFQSQTLPQPMSAGTPAVVVSKGLNLRAGPGADYQDIGDLRRCDRLEVMGEYGDWLEVEAYGVRAWVHGDYVSFDLSLCPTK